MSKGHPKADILMEIAKEAEVNPEFWKEFEILWPSGNKTDNVTVPAALLANVFYAHRTVRRIPKQLSLEVHPAIQRHVVERAKIHKAVGVATEAELVLLQVVADFEALDSVGDPYK